MNEKPIKNDFNIEQEYNKMVNIRNEYYISLILYNEFLLFVNRYDNFIKSCNDIFNIVNLITITLNYTSEIYQQHMFAHPTMFTMHIPNELLKEYIFDCNGKFEFNTSRDANLLNKIKEFNDILHTKYPINEFHYEYNAHLFRIRNIITNKYSYYYNIIRKDKFISTDSTY